MSFVTTQPEALAFAAGRLQTLGSAMASENVAAAALTTGVVPAAADQVSALQAAIFAAYGNLYQSVYAQAQAIHELFVNTLTASSGSYAATEATNQAVAASPLSGLSGLFGGLTGSSGSGGVINSLTSTLGNSGLTGLSGNSANVMGYEAGNWASALLDVIGLGGGGLIDPPADAAAEIPGVGGVAGGLEAGLDGAVLTGAVGPTGSADFGGAPMLASLGQATSVGGLSVPPSWAGATPAVAPGAATLTGAGWTAPAPQSTPVATMPAGMPSVATTGKAGGLGAPRYGVKPTVMGRPAVV